MPYSKIRVMEVSSSNVPQNVLSACNYRNATNKTLDKDSVEAYTAELSEKEEILANTSDETKYCRTDKTV